MAGVAFQPMARCARIPKKPVVVKEEEQEGGSLLQVLGRVEVDLVSRVLGHLDPISLMAVELTGRGLREFQASQRTWQRRAHHEAALTLPATKERWRRQEADLASAFPDTNTDHLRHKARALRAWNLGLNWQLGQFTKQKLVSFNCNHDGCGERCGQFWKGVKPRPTLNPVSAATHDYLPSQVIGGDLVIMNLFNQYTTDDETRFYSIREDRMVEVYDPADAHGSLIDAVLSCDRTRVAVLHWVDPSDPAATTIQAKLSVLEAATYRVEARLQLPLPPELHRQIYSRPGEGALGFLDNNTVLFFLNDSLIVIEPFHDAAPFNDVSATAAVKADIKVPELVGFKVQLSGRYLCGLQPRMAVVYSLDPGEAAVTEVWRKPFAATSFPPVNLTSLRLAFPFLFVGKSHGVLETWNVATDQLVVKFDKAEIVASPRPGIHDVKVLDDKVITTNFGGHLCVWDRAVLEGRREAGGLVPAYRLELKYEQDFYADETQLVYIEEMGGRDMEMMTVSRIDFWPICQANLERARKGEETKPKEAPRSLTYAKRYRDPRKRKIGNAGIKTAAKKPSLANGAVKEAGGSSQGEEGEGSYHFEEEHELVDDREEAQEVWEPGEEDDRDQYDYGDGEGLL